MARGMGNRSMRRAMMRKLGGTNPIGEPMPGVREVLIRTERDETIVAKPSVMKMEVDGNTTFTVTSNDIEERELEAPVFKDEDVDLVCQQTGVGRDRAADVLTETGGDIAQAIMRLGSG